MTRGKVKLAYITNDSVRKTTFKKRRKGMFKKIDELTTLCDIEGCAIISSPYEDKPEVWPNLKSARKVISRFKSFSEEDQGKKMLDEEAFLKQRVAKARAIVEKMKSDSKEEDINSEEKEITEFISDCISGNEMSYEDKDLDLDEAKNLGKVANKALEIIRERLRYLKEQENLQGNEA